MSIQTTHARILFVVGLILAAVVSRLLPHPPNFTPVVAVALFAGAQLAPRWLALLVPIVALMLTDLVYGFHVTLPAVYLAVALIVVLGQWCGRGAGGLRVAGSALGSATLFFVVTNLAVWAFGGLYSLDPAGLLACFVAAIPFFGYTLAGTALYTLILFGGLALAQRLVPALKETHAQPV